jgi:hypothetical protein
VSCDEQYPLWVPDIPESARDAVVPVDALHKVCVSQTDGHIGDSN